MLKFHVSIFFNTAKYANIFQLVGAWQHVDGSFGTTRSRVNICFVTLKNDVASRSVSENETLDRESVSHERGHHWLAGRLNGQVD